MGKKDCRKKKKQIYKTVYNVCTALPLQFHSRLAYIYNIYILLHYHIRLLHCLRFYIFILFVSAYLSYTHLGLYFTHIFQTDITLRSINMFLNMLFACHTNCSQRFFPRNYSLEVIEIYTYLLCCLILISRVLGKC